MGSLVRVNALWNTIMVNQAFCKYIDVGFDKVL